jgi:hypothetical protein
LVIDLDSVDEGLKVSLAERHRTGAEILGHRATELFDQRRVDPDLRRCRDRASFPTSLSQKYTRAVEPYHHSSRTKVGRYLNADRELYLRVLDETSFDQLAATPGSPRSRGLSQKH